MKRSCSQNHRAKRRCVIVHPGRDTDRGKAVSEDDHVLDRNVVTLGNMAGESVHISDYVGKTISGAALARGSPMPAGVPRKNREVLKAEEIDCLLPPAR